jgi:hypothetical protein
LAHDVHANVVAEELTQHFILHGRGRLVTYMVPELCPLSA